MGHPMVCWCFRIFLRKKFARFGTGIPFASPLHIFPLFPDRFRKNTNNALEPVPARVIRNGLLSFFEHMEDLIMIKRQYIDINEVIESYLPMSKKKARKFVKQYLEPKRIGNKIYVDRYKLEELLKSEDVESFPLD